MYPLHTEQGPLPDGGENHLIFYFKYLLQSIVIYDKYFSKSVNGARMFFHLTVTLLMLAALAAFLLLWYFWVKGKLGNSFFLEDEQQFLFPFRYFSWILLGVVLLTSVMQIHFLRVSSMVHEKLASMAFVYKAQNGLGEDVQDIKSMISALRYDLGPQFRPAETNTSDQRVAGRQSPPEGSPVSQQNRVRPDRAIAGLGPADRMTSGNGFAQEARSSSYRQARANPSDESRVRDEATGKGASMALDLTGRVTIDALRVRKRPTTGAEVIDKLVSGAQVKVTEKRIVDERMWYRVITPSGKAGWVDFRYLELQASSRP